MKKLYLTLTLVALPWSVSSSASSVTPYVYNDVESTPQSTEEIFLMHHIEKSISQAQALRSNLKKPQLDINGMSSAKNRHFLNNLCSLPHCTYLEIGTWKGSTLIGALFGNKDTLLEATACDNWSQFNGPEDEFKRNCKIHLKDYPLTFYDEDCFSFNLSRITHPVKVYFYDGDHTELAQELAFTYFNPVFDDVFIAIIDDWDWEGVRKGTFEAFKKLGYQVVFENALLNQEQKEWWNGLYVAVIKKA